MIDLVNILPPWLYDLLGNIIFTIWALLIAFGASSDNK
jgi:hypothetical protein